MENSPLDKDLIKFELDDELIKNLLEIARWARFISISIFIFLAFMAIAALSIGEVMKNMPAGQQLPFGPEVLSTMYLAFALIGFIPTFFLFKFSGRLKQAVELNDKSYINEAFRYLKSHYKFIGITVMITILLYLMAIISVGFL